MPGFKIYYRQPYDAIDRKPRTWFYPCETRHYGLDLITKFRKNHASAEIVRIVRVAK